MTGGGFGGSTVNLVRRDGLEEFKRAVEREYAQVFGAGPAVYVTDACDGAGEITRKSER
jgi:galactokinase